MKIYENFHDVKLRLKKFFYMNNKYRSYISRHINNLGRPSRYRKIVAKHEKMLAKRKKIEDERNKENRD